MAIPQRYVLNVDEDGNVINLSTLLGNVTTGLTGSQQTGGGATKTWVADTEVYGLLTKVLDELKMLNVHISMVTNNEVTKGDI